MIPGELFIQDGEIELNAGNRSSAGPEPRVSTSTWMSVPRQFQSNAERRASDESRLALSHK